MSAPLFDLPGYIVREIGAEAAPRLQRFFEANPEYHQRVEGRDPPADAGHEEITALPPAGFAYDRKWCLEVKAHGDGEMVAMIDLVAHLHARDVWHVGLFVVAASLHGSGFAQRLHAALEGWVRGQGARWMRLGAVAGNTRAEAFWEHLGYVEVRRIDGVPAGARSNVLRIMVKPLSTTIGEYFAAVPRDSAGG